MGRPYYVQTPDHSYKPRKEIETRAAEEDGTVGWKSNHNSVDSTGLGDSGLGRGLSFQLSPIKQEQKDTTDTTTTDTNSPLAADK